jgi:hypothetical protein
MLNYWNRTIEPILSAISVEFARKFLTKTARTQRQSIMFFKNPFRLVPVEQVAEIADKFTRNEIMTSNEMRQVIGMAPHPDPKADQLINSNMPQGSPTPSGVTTQDTSTEDASQVQQLLSDSFDQVDQAINDAFSALGSTNGSGP